MGMAFNKTIDGLLDEADEIINGEMDCTTPEYRAINRLRLVACQLFGWVEQIDKQVAAAAVAKAESEAAR